MLPKTVKPSKYNVRIQPDLKNFSFTCDCALHVLVHIRCCADLVNPFASLSGEEEVSIAVLEETREVVLNAIELQIGSAEFRAGGKSLTATKIDYDTKRETATFSFDQPLPLGGATLKLTFTGILNDKLKGYALLLDCQGLSLVSSR